ncbi:MAG: class I SAM-dependent methyltransferase [Pseudomonadota bacterium]
MNLTDIIGRLRQKIRKRQGRPTNHFPFAERQIPASQAMQSLEEFPSDLAEIFFRHDGRVVHKWLHYLDVYSREFARYRNKADVNFLEIGVFKGGSLEMWRKYFGPDAKICGVDINPDCADYVDAPNQVRIGSQADPAFLRGVVEEMGRPDIILDDGSHVATHQQVSFETLWPLLNHNGLYVIEDLHTAYFPGFNEGGYQRRGTAIEVAKQIVDDMHGWYHPKKPLFADKNEVASVRFYDSIVVIEKQKVPMPSHMQVGQVS